MVKNRLFIVGEADLIPELERSLRIGMATHSSFLAWEIPWTEWAAVLGVAKCQA